MSAIAHVTRESFADRVGEHELAQLAGDGRWNALDGAGPAIDEPRLASAIAYANELVESYVRGRYPAGVESRLLTDAAIDIARYRLRSTTNAATVSDEVRKRHEDAMRMLRDVQAGKQQLTAPDGQALPAADGAGGSVIVSQRYDVRQARTPGILEGYL